MLVNLRKIDVTGRVKQTRLSAVCLCLRHVCNFMNNLFRIRVVCVCGVSVFFENAVVCVCCVSPLFSNDIVCVCDVSVLRNYTYVRHYSVSALEKRTVVGVCACDVSFMCLRFRKYLISSFLDKTYGS